MTEDSFKPTNLEPDQVKARAVHAMFSAIAWRYDMLNRLLSFGIDQLWRREASQYAEALSTLKIF
ncbi:MAG: class I SAM-dependent methyltransferase [Deinococcales bacterium]